MSLYGNPGSPMQINNNGRKLLSESGFSDLYPKKSFTLELEFATTKQSTG